jgi:hypothetical protein
MQIWMMWRRRIDLVGRARRCVVVILLNIRCAAFSSEGAQMTGVAVSGAAASVTGRFARHIFVPVGLQRWDTPTYDDNE